MSWVNFFDEIYVINLTKRGDRLLQIAADFEKYKIPYRRISAIENANGAEGLKDTMANIFTEAIEKEYANVLVFEDDCDIVVGEEIFHDVMNKVVAQLPENYIMCFLGCQLSGGATHFHSPNLVAGQKMFSTHAVAYSLRGMKEIISHGLTAPIDNFYVSSIEPIGGSYCIYPLLCSQYVGYSDIGHAEISWKPFIEHRFEQKIGEMKSR